MRGASPSRRTPSCPVRHRSGRFRDPRVPHGLHARRRGDASGSVLRTRPLPGARAHRWNAACGGTEALEAIRRNEKKRSRAGADGARMPRPVILRSIQRGEDWRQPSETPHRAGRRAVGDAAVPVDPRPRSTPDRAAAPCRLLRLAPSRGPVGRCAASRPRGRPRTDAAGRGAANGPPPGSQPSPEFSSDTRSWRARVRMASSRRRGVASETSAGTQAPAFWSRSSR